MKRFYVAAEIGPGRAGVAVGAGSALIILHLWEVVSKFHSQFFIAGLRNEMDPNLGQS